MLDMTRSVLNLCLLIPVLLSTAGCGSYEAISETMKYYSKGEGTVDDAIVAIRKGDLIAAERALREQVLSIRRIKTQGCFWPMSIWVWPTNRVSIPIRNRQPR